MVPIQARAHLLISGVVQGVGFRAFVRDKAEELNVGGWVRNTPDGKVEAVLEGSRFKVTELIDLCRDGPPASSVRGVQVEWSEPEGDAGSFYISY